MLGARLIAAEQTVAAISPAGIWRGDFNIGDKPRPITVEIIREEGNWSASYEGSDAKRRKFREAVIDGVHVRLVTTGGSSFEGNIAGDTLQGIYRHDATRSGPFAVARVTAPVDRTALTGAYRSSTSGTVSLAVMNDTLFAGRAEDGWARALNPQPDGSYTYGRTLMDSTNRDGRLWIAGAAPQQILTLEEGGRTIFTGKHVPIQAEEVTFSNGEVKLSGTYYRPVGPGPFPTLILLHGSGPALRDGEPWIHALLADGFAVLTYDKRGCGQSTGGTWRASFDDYARDALAAVAAMRKRPEVDAKRIGLFGPSQGGYVGIIAASKSPDIGFLIIRSTSAVTPLRQEEYRLAKLLEIHGYPASDITAAREFVRTKFNAPISGDWSAYASAAERNLGAKWFDEVGGAPARDHPAHEFWRLNGQFDPNPLLVGLHCPILWLTPEFDESGPVQDTVAALKSAPGLIAHLIIPQANHGMLRATRYEVTEENLANTGGYAPEFLRSIRRWLANNVK